MIKVLFVCLGNICRSPLAEAIFNHKLKLSGLTEKFYVDSCGTGDYHIGSQPDSRTVFSAHKHGMEIEHACRQLIKADLMEFHYILAMDNSNYRNILLLADLPLKFSSQVLMMRHFDSFDKGSDVPDPYHGDAREFQLVFDILNRSLDGFIAHLAKEHAL